MSLIIPDPRFEMPELFEPGRKPVGNIVVNKSNEFGEKIEYLQLFREGNGSSVLYDEVKRQELIINGAELINGGCFFNSNFDNLSAPDADQLEGKSEYTIFFVVRRTGTLSLTRSRIFDKNGGVMAMGFTPTSFDIFQGAWRTTSYTMPSDKPIAGCATFKNGTIKKFIDGVLIGSNTGVPNTGTGSGVFFIGNQDDDDIDFWPGYMYAFGYSYAAISDGAAIELTRHPFGSGDNPLLIPA